MSLSSLGYHFVSKSHLKKMFTVMIVGFSSYSRNNIRLNLNNRFLHLQVHIGQLMEPLLLDENFPVVICSSCLICSIFAHYREIPAILACIAVVLTWSVIFSCKSSKNMQLNYSMCSRFGRYQTCSCALLYGQVLKRENIV